MDNYKEYWDNYWIENKEKRSFFNACIDIARKYYFAKQFALFIAKHYDVRGKTICEIGSGSGQTLAYLKKFGAKRCVGIDYSEEGLKYAKTLSNNCEFFLGDAFNLKDNFKKEYDFVYSLGLLEHYSHQDQLKLIDQQKSISTDKVFIEVPYNIFCFRWLFAINKLFGRTTTFSDEELFDKETFKNLSLKGNTKLMPKTFFLTIGHFEDVEEKL